MGIANMPPERVRLNLLQSPMRAARSAGPMGRSLLLVMLGLLGAGPAAAQTTGDVSAGAGLGPILSCSVGASSFFNRDMDQTYGIVPSFLLRCAVPLQRGGEVFIGGGYLGDSGDPYHDVGGFSGGPSSRLRAMPLEVGVRGRPLRRVGSGLGIGLALQYVRVTERFPGSLRANPLERVEMTAWGWGLRVLALQEWWLPGTKWALGVEVSTGLGSAPVDYTSDDHRVSLAGVDLRGCVSFLP